MSSKMSRNIQTPREARGSSHRRSLARSAGGSMPRGFGRRRRSLGSATPNRSGNSLGQANDDAAEKRATQQRRKARRPSLLYTPNKAGHGRGGMNTPRLLGWTNRRTPMSRPVLHSNALAEMYENVLTRVSKNSINKKNAWGVNLCHYVKQIVDMDKDNFTRNGSVINTASIVLAHQIDSVHDRGHTVLKNLVTKSEKKDSAAIREAARQRRRMNKKTLATSGITTKIELLLNSRDPLFEKTAASFDAGGVKGLMLSNLTTHKEGSLIFSCEEKLQAFSTEKYREEMQVIPRSVLDNIPLPSKKRLKRCRGIFPQAQRCSQTIEFYKRQKEAIEQGLEEDSVFDQSIDLTQKIDFEDSIIEDSSFMVGDDVPAGEISEGGALAGESPDELLEKLGFDGGERFIWDGDEAPEEPHAFRVPDFDNLHDLFDRDNNWTGGRGRNLRRIQALRKRDQGLLVPTKERKRRKVNYFDFVSRGGEERNLEVHEMTEEEIEAQENKLRNLIMQQVDQRLFTRAEPSEICLPERTEKKWQEKEQTLPQDMKLKPDMFFRCSLRPSLQLHCPERALMPLPEEPMMDPLGEMQDPGAESSMAPPFDFPDEPEMPEVDIGGPVPIMDENLGEMLTNFRANDPKAKLEIPYTREPCDFNVSLMKKRIWRRICAGKVTEDGNRVVTYTALLRGVVRELPKRTADKISVHILYVCLLYCCNEYNLRLKQPGLDDCDNFQIFTTAASPVPK